MLIFLVPFRSQIFDAFLTSFYTPVFRRDVLWYGDVRPSGSPSVRPSQFSALFSYMLWHIDLKFCVSLNFYARKIKFECHQFPSLFAGVMLLFNFKLLQIYSFPHFSPTCFDILSSNFVCDFVLMYHRASLSVVILLQFLLELCLVMFRISPIIDCRSIIAKNSDYRSKISKIDHRKQIMYKMRNVENRMHSVRIGHYLQYGGTHRITMPSTKIRRLCH